jgi:periplasmic copper chaperone A
MELTMKNILSAAAMALLLAQMPPAAFAHDHSAMTGAEPAAAEGHEMSDTKAGELTIGNAFARATLPGAKVGGAYVTIANTGSEADRLLGGSTAVASHVEVHEMKMDGNIMQMRKLKEGLAIPAGETVQLAPGGLHLMLMGLKQPLKEGEMLPVTLEFEKSGKVELEFMVGPANGAGMEHK